MEGCWNTHAIIHVGKREIAVTCTNTDMQILKSISSNSDQGHTSKPLPNDVGGFRRIQKEQYLQEIKTVSLWNDCPSFLWYSFSSVFHVEDNTGSQVWFWVSFTTLGYDGKRGHMAQFHNKWRSKAKLLNWKVLFWWLVQL